MNYTPTQKLSAKDIQALLVTVTLKTAEKHLKDIKEHYNTSIVMYCHFEQYFNIPKQLYQS